MSSCPVDVEPLITAFEKYASKEGDKKTLNKAQLKELLENEFGGLVGRTSNKEEMDRIFRDLDANADDRVDFMEYGRNLFALIVMCHPYLR